MPNIDFSDVARLAVEGEQPPARLPQVRRTRRDLEEFARARGFTITSTTGGEHKPGSAHYRGDAIDMRTRDKRPAEVDNFVAEARREGFHIRDERQRPAGQKRWRGPHIHGEVSRDEAVSPQPPRIDFSDVAGPQDAARVDSPSQNPTPIPQPEPLASPSIAGQRNSVSVAAPLTPSFGLDLREPAMRPRRVTAPALARRSDTALPRRYADIPVDELAVGTDQLPAQAAVVARLADQGRQAAEQQRAEQQRAQQRQVGTARRSVAPRIEIGENDLRWHRGLTAEEFSRLSPAKQRRVAADVARRVRADRQARASGSAVSQPHPRFAERNYATVEQAMMDAGPVDAIDAGSQSARRSFVPGGERDPSASVRTNISPEQMDAIEGSTPQLLNREAVRREARQRALEEMAAAERFINLSEENPSASAAARLEQIVSRNPALNAEIERRTNQLAEDMLRRGQGIQQRAESGKKLPPRGFTETVGAAVRDFPSLLPVVGGFKVAVNMLELRRALERVSNAQASEADKLLVAEALEEAERDSTWGATFADIVTQLPGFAGEIALTGGWAGAARVGGRKVAGELAEHALKKRALAAVAKKLEGTAAQRGLKVAGRTAEGLALETPARLPLMAGRVVSSAQERALGHELETGEQASALDFADEGLLSTYFEVASEGFGGLLSKLAPRKVQALKRLFRIKAAQHPGSFGQFAAGAQRLAKATQISNPIAESLEERVNDLAQRLTGLEDDNLLFYDKGIDESFKQLMAEIAAFSLPAATQAPALGAAALRREAAKRDRRKEETANEEMPETASPEEVRRQANGSPATTAEPSLSEESGAATPIVAPDSITPSRRAEVSKDADIIRAGARRPVAAGVPPRDVPGVPAASRAEEARAAVAPETAPPTYAHTDFGTVVEAPDQAGVPAGKVRVVEAENPAASHTIQKPGKSGRGNERAVPVRGLYIAPKPAGSARPPAPVDVQTPTQRQTPVPESPQTLRAQFASARDPQSPRAAVLVTPGEELRRIPTGFTAIQLDAGVLHLHRAKARALGLTSTQKIKAFIAARGFEPLIGKVSPVADTSQGVSLRTEDAAGRVLSTSVVMSEAAAAAQADMDRAQFPQASRQELLPTADAAERRGATSEKRSSPVAVSPVATTSASRQQLTRNYRAGANDATLTFASAEQRDLYDVAANARYRLRGGQNKTSQRAVRDTGVLVPELAQRLGVPEAQVPALASRVYDDVRAQMKGVRHLEKRAVADRVLAQRQRQGTTTSTTPVKHTAPVASQVQVSPAKRELTPKEMAGLGSAEKIANRQPRRARKGDPERDTLFQYLVFQGGIRPAQAIDLAALKGLKIGIRPLVNKNGVDVEDAFRNAVEDGYLSGLARASAGRDNYDDKFTVDDFIEAVAESARSTKASGNRAHYSSAIEVTTDELDALSPADRAELDAEMRFLADRRVIELLQEVKDGQEGTGLREELSIITANYSLPDEAVELHLSYARESGSEREGARPGGAEQDTGEDTSFEFGDDGVTDAGPAGGIAAAPIGTPANEELADQPANQPANQPSPQTRPAEQAGLGFGVTDQGLFTEGGPSVLEQTTAPGVSGSAERDEQRQQLLNQERTKQSKLNAEAFGVEAARHLERVSQGTGAASQAAQHVISQRREVNARGIPGAFFADEAATVIAEFDKIERDSQTVADYLAQDDLFGAKPQLSKQQTALLGALENGTFKELFDRTLHRIERQSPPQPTEEASPPRVREAQESSEEAVPAPSAESQFEAGDTAYLPDGREIEIEEINGQIVSGYDARTFESVVERLANLRVSPPIKEIGYGRGVLQFLKQGRKAFDENERGEMPLSPLAARSGFHHAALEERKALRIPPAWTDVEIADDPDARLIAVGRDGKGRTQRLYSAAHTQEALVTKFIRQREFNTAMPELLRRIEADLDGQHAEEASVLRLLVLSGFRVGGDADTHAKVKAFGASTLRPEHVIITGDTVHFDFIGKLGARQQHSIMDAALANDIGRRLERGGDTLFATNDGRVRAYLHSRSGDKAFKVHDFRTWNATEAARSAIERMAGPNSAEEYWNRRDEVGDISARKLGDTRKIVLETYIDPLVFEDWRKRAGVGENEQRPKQKKRPSAAADKPDGRDLRPEAGADERLFRDQPFRRGTSAREENDSERSRDANSAVQLSLISANTDKATEAPLKMARLDTLRAIENAAELTPAITSVREGNLLTVNAEGQEFLRRAFEQVQIDERGGDASQVKEGAAFDGSFLEPSQVRRTVKVLSAAVKQMRAAGYAPVEIAPVKALSANLIAASKAGKGTAVVKYTAAPAAAVPHESFHQGSYLGAAGKDLAARHANLAALAAHPVVAAWHDFYSTTPEYADAGRGVAVEEAAATMAGGDYAKLGVTTEQASEFLDLWFESYIEANGVASVADFERQRDEIKEAIKRARARFSDPAQVSGDTAGRAADRFVDTSLRGSPQASTPDAGRASASAGETLGGETSGAGSGITSGEMSGETRRRSLPATLRAQGLQAADEIYEIYPDKAATADAKRLLEQLGFDGSRALLNSGQQLGAEHVQLSKILQRALLSEAANISETDAEGAAALRLKQQELASTLAAQMTKGGQFIRGAQVVDSSAEDVMAAAVRVAKERGRELTPREGERVQAAGEELERATAGLEAAAGLASEARRQAEADEETAQRAAAGALTKQEIERLQKRLANLRAKEKRREDNIAELEGRMPARARKARPVGERRAPRVAVRAQAIELLAAQEAEMLERVRAALGGAPLKMAQLNPRADTPTTALPAETFDALAQLGALKLLRPARGTLTVADFKRQMVAEFGGTLRPEIDRLHAESVRLMRATLRQANRERELERIAAREGHEDLTREELEEIAGAEHAERKRVALIQAEHDKAARKEASQRARTVANGTAEVSTPALARAISRHATTDLEAISAAKLSQPGMTPDQFNAEMAEEHALVGKALREAWTSGGRVLEAARRDVQTSRQLAAALKRQAAESERERDQALAVLQQARGEQQRARARVAGEFRRLNVGAVAYYVRQAAQISKGVMISIQASGDFSHLFRQGGLAVWMQPHLLPQFVKQTLKSTREAGFASNIDRIEQGADFVLKQRMGIDFAFAGNGKDHVSGEEMFEGSEVLQRIPIVRETYGRLVKKSDEVFGGGLDHLRDGFGQLLIDALRAGGVTYKDSPQAYRDAGKFVNIITGRADVGPHNRALTRSLYAVMRLIGFSPRYRLSRLQFLALPFDPTGIMYRSHPAVRRAVWKYVARYYATMGALIGGLSALGYVTGVAALAALSPDDDDFLKLKIGNFRLDLTSGHQTQARFLLRMMREAGRNLRGDVTPAMSGERQLELTGRWLRSGMDPRTSLVTDWYLGEDFTGKPFKWGGLDAALATRLMPINISNAYRSTGEAGARTAGAQYAADFLGLGTSVYPDNPDKPRSEAEKLAARFVAARIPIGTTQSLNYETRQLFYGLKRRARQGEDVTAEVDGLFQAERISERKAEEIKGAGGRSRFQENIKRLPLKDAEHVLKSATPAERASVAEIMRNKQLNAAAKAAKETEKRENPERARVLRRRSKRKQKLPRIDFSDVER